LGAREGLGGQLTTPGWSARRVRAPTTTAGTNATMHRVIKGACLVGRRLGRGGARSAYQVLRRAQATAARRETVEQEISFRRIRETVEQEHEAAMCGLTCASLKMRIATASGWMWSRRCRYRRSCDWACTAAQENSPNGRDEINRSGCSQIEDCAQVSS
jgi:hypothetical protein